MTDVLAFDPDRRSITPHPETPGEWRVRMSAFNSCPKALGLQAAGKTPPVFDDVQRAYDQGHLHEEAILDWFVGTGQGMVEGEVRHYQQMSHEIVVGSVNQVTVQGSSDLVTFVDSDDPNDLAVYVSLTDAKTITIKQRQKIGSEHYGTESSLKTYLLRTYGMQIFLYATDLLTRFNTIPDVFFAIGWINRDTGKIESFEYVRLTYREVEEAVGGRTAINAHADRVTACANEAVANGWESLGTLDDIKCTPPPFGCGMGDYHAVVDPATPVALDGVPADVREAFVELSALEKFKPITDDSAKRTKTAKAAIRSWLVGLGDAGVGKRVVGEYEVKLSEGTAKETVNITPEDLRAELGDVAEKYITTKPGAKTMTVKHVGAGWTTT